MVESHSREASADMIVVRKAKDLDPSARAWVVSLFGRELRDDEEITVAIPDTAEQRVLGDRAQARRRLLASMEQLADKFKDVPDDEMEAILDEAMKAVRPSYEPLR